MSHHEFFTNQQAVIKTNEVEVTLAQLPKEQRHIGNCTCWDLYPNPTNLFVNTVYKFTMCCCGSGGGVPFLTWTLLDENDLYINSDTIGGFGIITDPCVTFKVKIPNNARSLVIDANCMGFGGKEVCNDRHVFSIQPGVPPY